VRLQKTIKKELVFRGRGLHTGKFVVMKLKPAPRDTGIVFYRSDKGEHITADVNSVSDTAFATTLGSNGTRVRTVEHILAAAAGLGVDNMIIELNGPEVPILDGSSEGFVRRILDTGIARQASNRQYIKVVKPVFFKEGQVEVSVFPYDGTKISYQIYFNHCLLGEQKMTVEIGRDSFMRELAPARTFGFLKDVEYLKACGLAKGGSLENAVILTEKGVLNASGLRFKDEFIRHKILDFIGDIALLGFPIYGHFIVSRSGHTTNIKFLKKLLSSPECWQVVTGVDSALKATA
jgi:UDP-3-O-[3-hydroxymyristoyl] N-acetylglucosamine deacetylase